MNRRLLPTLLFAGTIAAAENLVVENPSFETGSSGFEAVMHSWVRTWPQVVQPQVVGDTAAQGAHSLRLDNGSGYDSATVTFAGFAVAGPATLTFSFWARSADDGTPVRAQLCCGSLPVVDGQVTLDRTWRRYQVSGPVGAAPDAELRKGGIAGRYAPAIRLASTVAPVWRTVWLDGLQVERASTMGPFATARALDAAVDLADHAVRRLLVYTVGEAPVAELRVAGAPAAAFTAAWRLRDVLDGRLVADGTVAGVTDGQGCALATFALPPAARRLYRIEADVRQGGGTAVAERCFGAIADRSSVPGGRFGGSLETYEEARAKSLPAPDPSHRLTHYRESPELYAALARRLGWSWIHLYRQTSPLAVMPAPGTQQFADTDAVVDLLRGHDLEILALLSSHGSIGDESCFPAWMMTGPPSRGGTSRGVGKALPDPAAWEAWCGAMAARYRGRIAAWEIWNEPGVKMREADYLPYHQAAWRAVKAADPQALVLGLCGTWDVGGDLYGWIRGCLKLGAGDGMDAIAIHGYHTRDRDYVARVRAIARELSGRDWPIWDTESGAETLAPYPREPLYALRPGKAPITPVSAAEFLVRHYANELAGGVDRLSWFNLCVPWTTIGRPGFSLLNHDGSPDLALIAANVLCEAFHDARPWPGGQPAGSVVTYVFERPSGPLLVYWSDEDSGTARIPVAGARPADFLGGPLPAPSADGWTTIPIGPQPRFLTAPGLDAAALATAAAGLEPDGMRPLRLESAVLGAGDGRPTLHLTLANRTATPRRLALSTRSMPAWLQAAPGWTGVLAARSTASVVLPLAVAEPTPDGALRLVAESGDQVLTLPLDLRVMAAGATARPWPLADWCSLAIAHDATGLRIHGEIRDDQVAMHADRAAAKLAPWQGDCVELFFDWERTADLASPACDGDDTQLLCVPPGLAPAGPGRVVVGGGRNAGNRDFPIELVTYGAQRTATGWSFDLTIPWACAERLGCRRQAILGFAATVHEVGADWRERRLVTWGGGADSYRSPAGYGLLLLR